MFEDNGRLFDLSGRIALVTGSARGLGAAIARCLAQAGADVAVNYTSESSLPAAEEVAEYIRSLGRRAIVVRADVSKKDDVIELLRQVDETFGKLDILCCNAGVNSKLNIFNMELEEWQRIQDTNITGAFLCCKYAIPLMQRNHYGRIILTSSQCGQNGTLFGQVHYGASKGAQLSFAKTLARTVAPDNITVNCVAPGSHMTETYKAIVGGPETDTYKAAAAAIPLKRIGSCEDVGYAFVYLASEEAGYVTGSCLDVNGGSYMRS